MKYLVSISYYKFTFTDAEEAMSFAQMARLHYTADKDERNIDIEIMLIDKEEDDE